MRYTETKVEYSLSSFCGFEQVCFGAHIFSINEK